MVEESKRDGLLVALLVFCLAGILWNGTIAMRIDGSIATLISVSERPMTSTIHWASGNTTEVHTPRTSPNEAIESLTERHNLEVAYVKAHPPDGESLP